MGKKHTIDVKTLMNGYIELDFHDGFGTMLLKRWEAEELYFLLGAAMQDQDNEASVS